MLLALGSSVRPSTPELSQLNKDGDEGEESSSKADSKSNIRVCLRVRPMTDKEAKRGDEKGDDIRLVSSVARNDDPR